MEATFMNYFSNVYDWMPMFAQRVHNYYDTISSPTTDSCRNLVQNFERVCRKKTQTILCYEDFEQRKRKVKKAKMLLMQRRKRKRERYGLASGISESRKMVVHPPNMENLVYFLSLWYYILNQPVVKPKVDQPRKQQTTVN